MRDDENDEFHALNKQEESEQPLQNKFIGIAEQSLNPP